jgi:hypothetical protein
MPNVIHPTELAWYKMDDNAADTVVLDAMGYAHGTLLDEWNTEDLAATGRVDGGLDFSSIAAHVNTGVLPSQPFTMAYWLKPSAVAAFHATGVDIDPVLSGPDRFALGYGTNGRVWARWPAGNVAFNHTIGYIEADVWAHLALAISEDTMYCWCNGVLVASEPSGTLEPTVPLFIAATNESGTAIPVARYMSAVIDDVRFYNACLTTAEVYALARGLATSLAELGLTDGPKKVYAATGLTLVGPSYDDGAFDVAIEDAPAIVTPGTEEAQTINDREFTVSVGASYDPQYRILVYPDCQDPTWIVSNDASIAAISGEYAARVADGLAWIGARNRYRRKGAIKDFTRAGGDVVTSFDGFVAGSFSAHATDQVDDRLAGKTSEDMPIFSAIDHATPGYTRNAGCWAAGIDLTPIAVYNSTSGDARRGAVLISPRHVLMAEHYPVGDGATIRFVDAANNVIARTISDHENIGPANSADDYLTDLRVGLLSSDVSGITPVKVLPSDYADYMPSHDGVIGSNIPILALDQQMHAIVDELYRVGAGGQRVLTVNPDDDLRSEFVEGLVTGDSGQGGFLVNDGALILLTTWTYGWGSGPSVTYLATEINAAMTSLGGGYTLTEADLSGFTSYA